MAKLHVLRVFVDEAGRHGNPLGVFLDGPGVAEERRQGVAAELGFSETVFVDDLDRGEIRIFTPVEELGFAGHPTVGTAWLLARDAAAPTVLRPPAGDVPVRLDGDTTWIAARPEWVFPMEVEQLGAAAEVDAVDPGGVDQDREFYFWAWEDEEAGLVRSRALFPGAGIPEDEATGAAAVVICGLLGRPLRIHQGGGSILHARPLAGGMVEVGGRCLLDEVRDLRA